MERFTNRREFLARGATAAGLMAFGGILVPDEADAAPAPSMIASARDFGAKGDGKTDDTAALQKAFKDSPGGTAIFLPRGDYVISGAIDMGVNQSMLGEPFGARIVVRHYDAPAVRVPTESRVSDIVFIYPDNGDLANPRQCPETISLLGNGAGYIDNITFANAFVGVGTPKGGANCGQSVIRKLNGFVHDTMVHIDGSLDIIRIENVHCFVPGGPTDNEKAYYRTHRKCFHMQSTDGLMISKSFMILGKTFFLKEPGNHGPALSSYLTQCWVEAMSDYCFQINDCTRVAISDTEMTSANAKALIELNKGAFARITGCYFRDSMNSTGVVINQDSGAIISDCEFFGSPGFTGIKIDSDARTIISNNYIHHCEVGITCSKGADNYLITNNQLSLNNTPLVGAEGRKALVKDNA